MKLNVFKLSLLLVTISLLAGCGGKSVKEIEKQQQLAHIHYRLGLDALNKKGMLPKAFDELMQSDALNPNQPIVLDALAYAWLLRNNLKKSESFYKKSLKYGAGAATRNNYANLLNKMQRFPEAETMARKALDDPRYPKQDLAYINLGNAMLGQRKTDAAIQAYRQAQLFNPDSRLPQLKLAEAYVVDNRLNEAKMLYQALYNSNNKNRTIVEAMVNIHKQQNNIAEAKQLLIEFGSDNAAAPMEKAWAMDMLERLKR